MLINDNEENDSREIYLHDDNINLDGVNLAR